MRLRVLLSLALACAGLVLIAPAADAAPYPPSLCPTLSVSTTHPQVGSPIVVTGVNFDPNARIRLELHSSPIFLENVTSGSDGTFTTQVTMPANVSGHHDIVAIGGGSTAASGCPADPFQDLAIQGASAQAGGGSGGTTSGTSSSGGGTAYTGVDVLALLAAALVLIVGGVALNNRSRTRRVSASR